MESSIHKQQERLHEYIYENLPRPIGFYCHIGGGNAGFATGVTDSCATQLADANNKINELTQSLDLLNIKVSVLKRNYSSAFMDCINGAQNFTEIDSCTKKYPATLRSGTIGKG